MDSEVTLMVVEGKKSNHETTGKVFEKMSSLGGWGHRVYVKKEMTYREAIRFEIGGQLEHLPEGSSHALVCTWDGFVANPHLWTTEWLNYDMVGSPWPKSWNTGNQVGNMGFCLLSRRFMEKALENRHLHKEGEASDVFLCQRMHTKFTEEGIKYAPTELAAMFGWEYDVEGGLAGPDRSFGFHGWVNGKSRDDYYAMLEKM